jgi:hypothetical protein
VAHAIAKSDEPLEAVVAQARALLPRVNAGDHKARAALRELLDGAPDLWLSVGNLASQAEQSMIAMAAGDNAVFKEAIERKLRKLRRELAGSEPAPLECLLVDRVVAGWLALSYAEASYHQAQRNGLDWTDSEYMQRRIDRAQRRYLAAIRTLATVRRLLVPTMQVNIADRQINVAG